MGYLLCPLCCGRTFSNRKSLQYHLLASESNISCPECNQLFGSIVELVEHLELDTCEQQAVVISVMSEDVDHVRVSDIDLAKCDRDLDYDDAGRTLVLKEEVVEEDPEDPESWIIQEDGIPVDETTNYEIALSDVLNVSHDSDAIQQWERQVPDDEETEHYCNSCNCRVQGVLEHINTYHASEMVVLQNAEVVDTEVVETELGSDDEDAEQGYPCNRLPPEASPPATTGPPRRRAASKKNAQRNPDTTNASRRPRAKARLPKVYGTVDEANMVDAKTGIPYVRRIVHIEKFWETESFRLSLKEEGGGDSEGEAVVGGRRKALRVDSVAVPNRKTETPAAKRKKPAPVREVEESGMDEEALVRLLEADEAIPQLRVVKAEKKTALPTLCEVCGVKVKSARNLRAHMETHDPASRKHDPVTCEVCHTRFTTAGGLKVHMRMHRPDNVKKVAEMNNKVEYRCDLCNMVCYSERTFGIHYRVHVRPSPVAGETEVSVASGTPNTRDADVLTCKLCEEAFSSNEDLKTHWRAHFPPATDNETPPAQQYACSVCNKHFAAESNLEFHMTTHRTELELECLTCKTKFTDPDLLKEHRKTHAGTDRPYPCGFCGRRFSRPHEKVKHERIHTGEKPYECAACGMRFRVGYCLKMHERIHTGVRPYACEHCGKTFRARSGYKQHVRLHSNVRAFLCPFCPKTFKTVVQLAGHKKSHTKPYSCPHCGRRFATMYMVRSHVNTHAKSSLKHCCYICGASYGRDYALRDHIKTHGKNVPPPPGHEEEEEEDGGVELASDVSNDTNNS